jgi:rubrerythrin
MSEDEQINQILSRALKMEKFGQNFFSLLEELADDAESRKLFRRLAAEEDGHCDMFMAELRQNGGSVVQSDDFDPDRVFNKGVAAIIREGPASVFRYAIEVEERAIDFYNKSMDRMQSPRIRKFLSGIIDFEERHMRLLNINLALARAVER